MKKTAKKSSAEPEVFIVLKDMDDLSKNIFMKALNKAKELCDGSQCELSRRLKLELRRTQYWFANNSMPHYEKAKDIYPKLLAIIEKEMA